MEAKRITFDGLKALEITTRKIKLVVITELGPRIAFFGLPNGENVFYWKNDLLGREGWRLLGGHRVWATRPGADESEDAYAADNEQCEIEESHGEWIITGAVHPFLQTRRGMRIRILNNESLEVNSFITNSGPMLYSGGVWNPTCILPRPGMEFGVPLGDRRLTWDIIKVVIPRTFAGHSSRINDSQITFNEDFMIVRPQGIETKRMIMAPLGILAMSWPEKGISFIKHAQFKPFAQYPLGCNLAIYNGPDNYMSEMETYGQERTLLPGETMTHKETWQLVNEVFDWQQVELFIDLSDSLAGN
jgi:hypothetical protein